MVRSARRATIVTIGVALLAGCATTQQEAARLQLNDARIRASAVPLRLGGHNRAVSVVSVAVLASPTGRSSAVLVTLRNRAPHPSSDLPLLVGVTPVDGHKIYLNRTPEPNYFQNHVPGIPANGLLRWVLTLDRRLPARAAPFATVGLATADPATTIRTLPSLRGAVTRGTRSGAVVEIRNASGIPQYQLQVYALAWRRGRYVAAGQATISDLGSSASARLPITLVGDLSGARLSLEVPPTIFN